MHIYVTMSKRFTQWIYPFILKNVHSAVSMNSLVLTQTWLRSHTEDGCSPSHDLASILEFACLSSCTSGKALCRGKRDSRPETSERQRKDETYLQTEWVITVKRTGLIFSAQIIWSSQLDETQPPPLPFQLFCSISPGNLLKKMAQKILLATNRRGM